MTSVFRQTKTRRQDLNRVEVSESALITVEQYHSKLNLHSQYMRQFHFRMKARRSHTGIHEIVMSYRVHHKAFEALNLKDGIDLEKNLLAIRIVQQHSPEHCNSIHPNSAISFLQRVQHHASKQSNIIHPNSPTSSIRKVQQQSSKQSNIIHPNSPTASTRTV